MKVNSISSRSRRHPARLAAATRIVRVVRESHATGRESQIGDCLPRSTPYASPLTNHYSPITHLLIGSAAIRNARNSCAINTKYSSNRYKFGCLRARCSRFFHSTNHQPHRATQPFLIAGACATFAPAPLRAFLIGTPFRLKSDLTHSQQTRKHFLIGTIRPTLAPAPLSTHHLSLITHHCFTQFRFATNRIRKIVALMKTKEKPRSIRYKFPSCAIGVPAAATQCRPVPGTRNFLCFRRNRIAACLGVLAVLTCPAASGPIWFAWLGMGA